MHPPTLIHVGLPKTGTTTLQQRLFAADPAVTTFWRFADTPEGVEVAKLIWLQDSIDYDQDEVDRLVSRARRRRPHAEALVFTDEGVTGGGVADRGLAAARLRASFPEGTVLIVLREQCDHLASMFVHHQRGFGLQHLDDRTIDEWLGDDPATGADGPAAERDYGRLVRTYEDIFGRDRIRIRLFEDLVADTERFLADVAAMIGRPVPPRPEEGTTHANRRQTLRHQKRDRLFRRAPRLSDLHDRLPDRVVERIDDFVQDGPQLTVELSDETRRLLRDRYREGNAWLAEAHGLDLEGHGYAV